MRLPKGKLAAIFLCLMLLAAGCHGAADQTDPALPSSSAAPSLSPHEERVPPPEPESKASEESPASEPVEADVPAIQTGLIREQVLESEEGTIHYSFFLPENYDSSKTYPLVVTMPGYDRMWFGEDSSGANLSWNGFTAWTELDEELIVVSAQLTDWGETSAKQANALTECFLQNFAVNSNRIYAAGYSAGGETMSRAVALRPDLYAAYLHCGSQWGGEYQPMAEEGVAVYIFMAENDEYYGSGKARDAYNNLHKAYLEAGYTEKQINEVLQVEIPDNAYFNNRGIYSYHDGGSAVFNDTEVLLWVLSHRKDKTAEDRQIKMITANAEVVITLNDSQAAADLVKMLPLELTLIERNRFAKGMTLPVRLSAEEPATREYQIGGFGYWDAGPDLAIFYDDIYKQTIVPVIPLGQADSGAESIRDEMGTVRLELMP